MRTAARYALVFLLALCAPAAAQIQGGVQQSGNVTAGDCTNWLRVGVVQDAGSPCGTGTGTVTSVSVTPANGVSGTVSLANPAIPAITISLGTITPSSVTIPSSGLILSGSSSGSSTLNAPATGGGVATLPAGTGTLAYSAGLCPTGSAGQVQYTNGSACQANANFTYDGSGNATLGTSLAIGGATIGTNALAVAGTANFSSTVNSSGNFSGANLIVGSSGFMAFGSNSGFESPASGTIELINSGATQVEYLSTPITATLQLGRLDADTTALTVAQILRCQGLSAGGTSNQAGNNCTLIAPPGKGTGAGGSWVFQTSPAGTTGTAVNAPVPAMTINSAQLVGFNKHLAGLGAAPTAVASGGTGSASLSTGANDDHGTVTGGTLSTSIVITFVNAFTNPPDCTVAADSAVLPSSVTTAAGGAGAATLTIGLSAATGAKFTYQCMGQ